MSNSKQNIETVTGDLEIDESIEIQKKGWVVQRIGWVLMFIFLGLASIGMFGSGVMSKKTIEGANQKMEYQKYFRFEARMEMKIDVLSPPGGTTVSFPAEYLQKFRIESVVPEPKENKTENNMVNYLFDGSGPMKISFYLIPQSMGDIKAQVRVNDQLYNFNQFIYP